MTDWRFWKVLGKAYPVKCRRTMSRYYFFLTLVQIQPPREKAWFRFWGRWPALGLQPFLAYPAVIKLRHGGEQKCFNSLRKAEDFVGSLSQSGTFAADPQGKREERRPPFLDPAGGAWWSVWRDVGVEGYGSLFFFFPLSSWDIIIFYSIQLSPCCKTNPPFFLSFFSDGD